MSESMVERVGLALKSVTSRGDDVITYNDMGRAALAAAREPTQEMIDAGLNEMAKDDSHVNLVPIFRAMIDAALK